MKRAIIISGLVSFCIAVLLGIVFLIFRKEIATLDTLRSVSDQPSLFEMEYRAAYDTDAFLEGNFSIPKRFSRHIISSDFLRGNERACSFITHNKEGAGYYSCRSYSGAPCRELVTICRPQKGYSSVSLSNLHSLGYKENDFPVKRLRRSACLASVFIPFEGFNEMGLFACVNVKDEYPSSADSDTFLPTLLVRLFLDRCAGVNDVLDVLDTLSHKASFRLSPECCFLISDSGGNFARISPNPADCRTPLVSKKARELKWQVETQGEGGSLIRSFISARNGFLSFSEVKDCCILSEVSCGCANIYDQMNYLLYLVRGDDESEIVSYSLL